MQQRHVRAPTLHGPESFRTRTAFDRRSREVLARRMNVDLVRDLHVNDQRAAILNEAPADLADFVPRSRRLRRLRMRPNERRRLTASPRISCRFAGSMTSRSRRTRRISRFVPRSLRAGCAAFGAYCQHCRLGRRQKRNVGIDGTNCQVAIQLKVMLTVGHVS